MPTKLICDARWLCVLHGGGFSLAESYKFKRREISDVAFRMYFIEYLYKDIKSKFSFVLVFCFITWAIKKENDNKIKAACRVGYSFPTSYRLIAFQLFGPWSRMVVVDKR